MKKITIMACYMLLAVATSLCLTPAEGEKIKAAEKLTLKVGDSYKINVKGKHIIWKSNNRKIASVTAKGIVKARKKGNVKVIALAGKKKNIYKVTVKKKAVKSTEKGSEKYMNLKIGDYSFKLILEDTKAAKEFSQMVAQKSVTLKLKDYAGNEKVGPLGKSLSAKDKRTTTHSGDIVLYCGNQIVMFYGSNTWEYTRIGKVDDLANWKKALGSGSVEVTFSMTER